MNAGSDTRLHKSGFIDVLLWGRGWKQLYSLAALSALFFLPQSVQRQNVLNCMIIWRQNTPSHTLAQLILITD